MSLQIMPPGMGSDESSKQKSGNKNVDRCEWFPSNLTDGESATFRLQGNYTSGHALMGWRYPQEVMGPDGLRFAGFGWSREYPENPENIARQTDWSKPDRPKTEGEFCKPKQCLAWTAYSQEQDRVVVLLIEQMGLKNSLKEILGDSDFTWDDNYNAEFLLRFTRKGAGLETTYSVMPKPKPVTAKETKAFDAVRDTALVTKFFDGGHPFVTFERPTFNAEADAKSSAAELEF